MTSQIIGLGGGGFSMEDNPLLDLYILSAAQKENPTICLLPTASADDPLYIQYFMQTFSSYPCNPKYLEIFCPRIRSIKQFLLDSDIIYVGGGNTKSMLGLWKTWGIDIILKDAYQKGIILAGVSAGFVCWFEQCVTDSIPRKLTSMSCLGLLKGSGCPHYDNGNSRRDTYHDLLEKGKVQPGYAAEDCVGLHFVDGQLLRAISSQPNTFAYYLYQDATSQVIEEKIIPEFLGNEEIYNKYLLHLSNNSTNLL